MFFFLSKTLDYALLPMLWVTIVLLYAVFTKSQTRRKNSLIASLVLLFFFGNGFIINEMIYSWQKEPVVISEMPQYQTAIILCGIVLYDENGLKDRVRISVGADRILHPVQLYKMGKVKKILISGGSGTLVGDKSSEAVKLKSVLMYSGVPAKDIILEGASRNTHESSVMTKKLVDSLGLKGNFLLVTSALHMRRAHDCFTKAGLKTDPFTVDYSPHGEFFFEQMIPTEMPMLGWTSLIREMVGYVAYKVMGYC